jgi:hypothetical protein
VDSFGGWDARARVDVDDFSNGVRMDEIAGNYQVICMPLRKAMLLARTGSKCHDALMSHCSMWRGECAAAHHVFWVLWQERDLLVLKLFGNMSRYELHGVFMMRSWLQLWYPDLQADLM